MNDPWATDPPKITAHQIHQVVGLIADYTEPEATELIRTLSARASTGSCEVCHWINGAHSRTCPTQGRD